jgi:hypothetical protein
MKHFVSFEVKAASRMAVGVLGVVAITGAGQDATFLIGVGFLAIEILRWRFREAAEVGERLTLRELLGGGRSKGSR